LQRTTVRTSRPLLAANEQAKKEDGYTTKEEKKKFEGRGTELINARRDLEGCGQGKKGRHLSKQGGPSKKRNQFVGLRLHKGEDELTLLANQPEKAIASFAKSGSIIEKRGPLEETNNSRTVRL